MIVEQLGTGQREIMPTLRVGDAGVYEIYGEAVTTDKYGNITVVRTCTVIMVTVEEPMDGNYQR